MSAYACHADIVRSVGDLKKVFPDFLVGDQI